MATPGHVTVFTVPALKTGSVAITGAAGAVGVPFEISRLAARVVLPLPFVLFVKVIVSL